MVSEKVAKWPFVVRKQVSLVKGTKMEQNEKMVGLDLGIFFNDVIIVSCSIAGAEQLKIPEKLVLEKGWVLLVVLSTFLKVLYSICAVAWMLCQVNPC